MPPIPLPAAKEEKSKDIESRLVGVETSIAWLMRVAVVRFGLLSSLALTG